LACPTPSSLMR